MVSVDPFDPDSNRLGSYVGSHETGPTERLIFPGPSSGRKTRRTVDLTPAQHRALDIWQRDTADRLGVARVTGQEVLSALVDQLLSDPKLSAQIIRTIRDRR